MAWGAAAVILLMSLQAGQFKYPPKTPDETKWPNRAFSNKITPAKSPFACTVAKVTDGDTFRCSNGVRVRLSAIDTAEMPGSCQPARQCAPGDPYEAKAALASLIAGRTVQCEPAGNSYNRIAAWCSVGGQDLSCAMLRSGHAIRLAKFDQGGRLRRC